MTIKQNIIPLFKVFMPKTVMDPLSEVLFSGYIGEGPYVKKFEKALVPWVNNPQVLACNNGTAAIHLALRLAGVDRDDEVISTPMTCIATNMPIVSLGARIVWADINPLTGEIDVDDVRKKITAKTKAIICVHWGGYPCALEELNALGKTHGIKIIEDACHAFGACYQNNYIGGNSDFVCFSFQAIKTMTTIDGGALACKDKSDYDRGKLLRWYGIDRESKSCDMRCCNDIAEYGYKYHMNDVAAVIGLEQLKYVRANLMRQKVVAEKYDAAFKQLSHVIPLQYVSDRSSSYWFYSVRVKNKKRFISYMRDKNICVSSVHERNDVYTVFKEYSTPLPGVAVFNAEHIGIPSGWWLTDSDIEQVIDAIITYA